MGWFKKSCCGASCAFVLLFLGVGWAQDCQVHGLGPDPNPMHLGLWVPRSLVPAGSAIPGDKEYAEVKIGTGGKECSYTAKLGWGKWSSTVCSPSTSAHYTYTFEACGGTCHCGYTAGYVVTYCYYWKDGVESAHDYDCDGIMDDVDTDDGGWDYDLDDDGYLNDDDPWPNDPDCPGSGSTWKLTGSWTHKTSNCNISTYTDESGNCSNAYTTTCTTETLGNTEDWWFNLPADNPPGPWPVPPGGDPDPGNPTDPDEDPDNEGEYGRIIQELQGIRENTSDIVSSLADGVVGGLGDVVDALGGVQSAVEAIEPGAFDTGPITSRQDTQTGLLQDIKAKIIPIGTGDLPDADLEDVNDNSSVGDDANLLKLDAEKGVLTDFLDDWWASNPIKSVVDGSGITASGSPSVALVLSFGSTSFDISALGPGLNTLGLILVGLAGLAGVITVVRD